MAYFQNLVQPRTGEGPADSSGLLRVHVDVAGFPPSEKGLEAGNYTLGASPECDLIIPEAPSEEILLLHVRTGGEPHELVSLARDIAVNGQPFNPQQRLPLMSETIVQVGAATITLTPQVSHLQRAGHLLRNVKAPASYKTPMGLLLVAFATGLLAWLSSGSGGGGGGGSADYAYMSPPQTLPPLSNATLTTPDEVIGELNRMFRAADLADRLTVQSNGRQVVVEGSVDSREERRMAEILQMVGARSRIDIHSRVKPDPSSLIGSIAGVSLSPGRYIVLRDGERYRAGELMPNGWTVDSIDEKSVTVSRDDLHETLDLTQ